MAERYNDPPDETDDEPVEPRDPLVRWHLAIARREEMQLDGFEWWDADPRRPGAQRHAMPRLISWVATRTGVMYRSTLDDGWLRTRAVSPPADFSADVWLGYNYMTPDDVLRAVIARVRDFKHDL